MLHFYAPCSCIYSHPFLCCFHYRYARQSIRNPCEKCVSPLTFLGNFQCIYTYFKTKHQKIHVQKIIKRNFIFENCQSFGKKCTLCHITG